LLVAFSLNDNIQTIGLGTHLAV